MENTRNPGFYAIAAGVALAVLFALLGITSVLSGRVGFGLAAACLLVAGLMYILYSRGNAVQRTGFGALVFIIAVGLIMPILFVNQQQAQADRTSQDYTLTLQRGAALFGQYCATCHGFQGQGINGPKLNNSDAVNALSDDDLTRIISGGIPGDPSQPAKLAMPAWSQAYGGSLTEDDISYLVSFIRSSDPKYLDTKGLPQVNGFSYVLGTLTNPTSIADYKEQLKGGGRPTQFTDMTGQQAVEVQIVATPNSAVAQWSFTPENIQISVGTTVTWKNVSGMVHTVVTHERAGVTPPDSFGSTTSILNGTDGTQTFTFTKPGDYPYYCSLHPSMIGWIQVK
ncbi:MAG TPA: c-type cytochrome [Ktedonobacterales bacterium]